MKTHHHKSKRQKLKQKYNLQKRVNEHKRRMKKEARRLGLQKKVRRDPGIPNSWPFKAEMLAELEEKKAARDADMEARRAKAKARAKHDLKQQAKDREDVRAAQQAFRKEKREQEQAKWNLQACRRVLPQADVILQVLDARDPMPCRCEALEAWAQEQKKRLVFVLAKADLITPETAANWIKVLGRVAPTVAAQAEAGREGVRDLLTLLGYAPATAPVQQVPAAGSVAVIGYAATGKKQLCKAIRQELKTTAAWLLDACRLVPLDSCAASARSALHKVVCDNVPRGAATATSVKAKVQSGAAALEGVDPVEVVKEMLARVPQQTVLRHYRLPAFQGVEGFLKTFATDRKVQNKKGKDPQPEYVAKRVLTELPALPGCFCTGPEAGIQGGDTYWAVHDASRKSIEAIMQAQVTTLSARGKTGPSAAALAIASVGDFGAKVDLASVLAGDADEGHISGEDDVSDSAEGSEEDMSMEGDYFEGEEEESEDESMDL